MLGISLSLSLPSLPSFPSSFLPLLFSESKEKQKRRRKKERTRERNWLRVGYDTARYDTDDDVPSEESGEEREGGVCVCVGSR